MSKLSEYLYGQGFTDDEIKDLISGSTPLTREQVTSVKM